MRKRLALVVVGCLALVGCSAAWDGYDPPEPPTLTTPSTGASLAGLGFTNAIGEAIWLPTGVLITFFADQPNLVIAAGVIEEAELVEDYLRVTLPGLGWEITADAPGGLLFTKDDWQGAYAVGADNWALTVRND
ncbi:MAG: hypothetical protein LBE83_10210 [Propionibacteriaceae bacterium]|jgi:hypothetical protein|nr:hypothetical protein [Propionibacteriaceae bacterium]